MKTDFINNMTHEFKTPIATISLAADSIASPKIIHDENKINRFIGIIRQENKRMLQQVEKVLQMAMIDKKDFQLKLSDVDLHELIRQAVEHLSLQVQQREGHISTNLEAGQPVIQGDYTHLSNVFHNLIDNANKYSDKSPEILISTFNINGGIQIIVEDKGIGMTKEDQKHIFDKFYRVHTGNLHDVKGFGLGLSYVKAITSAHQGSIDVKSEPGKGSKFSIYLPVRQKV
jgi:two-component system phosphate regulon sensor histidine kinase PhoR